MLLARTLRLLASIIRNPSPFYCSCIQIQMLQNAARRVILCHRNTCGRQWPLWSKVGQARAVSITSNETPNFTSFKGQQANSRTPKTRFFPDQSESPTIYALSSGVGRAGIAVIRISGPASEDICRALCHNTKKLSSRYAYVQTLYDPSDASNILDPQAVVIRLNKPTTQTGEDMLELHVHGGNATVKAVLQGISKVKSQHKIRYAEAGEFTRRAFANWKLDLPQVEALSDQLSAETEQQRRAAVRGSSYHLRATYTDWRKQLLNARGEMEALIDFSEDQHFDESPKQLLDGITKKVKAMRTAITLHQDASSRGELLRRGIRISLLGPSNAGKSSLLNQIVGREASIVSHEPGTTRDVVEVSLDLKGYLCTFADTAGLRTQGSESTAGSEVVNTPIGAVELEGIRRAKANASDSDLVIVLASVEESSSLPGTFEIKYDAESLNLAARRTSLVVINKWDLLKSPEQRDQLMKSFKETLKPIGLATFINAISCHEAESSGGENGHVDKVVKDIVSKFRSMTELPPELQDLVGVTERSRQLLAKATESLGAYLDEASWEHIEPDIVIAAEHLRDAAQSLARIVGKNSSGDVEEVLGVVFEKFCVGK